MGLKWTDAAALVPGVGTAVAIAGRKDDILDNLMPERRIASQMEENAKVYGDELTKLNEWFDKSDGRDFRDTTMGQTFINLLNQKNQEQAQQIDQKGAITGATNESMLSATSSNQKNTGDALSKMLQYGTSYNDAKYDSYFSKMLNLNQAKSGMELGAKEQIIAGRQRLGQNVQQFHDNLQSDVESIGKAAMLFV